MSRASFNTTNRVDSLLSIKEATHNPNDWKNEEKIKSLKSLRNNMIN